MNEKCTNHNKNKKNIQQQTKRNKKEKTIKKFLTNRIEKKKKT